MMKTARTLRTFLIGLALAATPLITTATCSPRYGTLDIYRDDDHHDHGFWDIFLDDDYYYDDCYYYDCYYYDEVIIYD